MEQKEKLKTDVCITVDVEFNINSTLHRQGNWLPVGEESVNRMEKGVSQGLGFILAQLQRNDLKATFFVEVLNVSYFGYEPMQRVIREIEDAGQDVQLHLHGCWNYFNDPDWREKARKVPPNERYDNWDVEDVCQFLEQGTQIFEKLTGKKPLALRMGGLQAHPTLQPAMKHTGILFGSNIGVAIAPPADSNLFLLNGARSINGVLEVPVTAYQDYRHTNGQNLKNMTVIGSSWPEIRGLLTNAHKQRVNPVVILTHASEFSFEKRTTEQVTYRKNALVQQRFINLCDYLAAKRDTYRAIAFSDGIEDWQQHPAPEKLLKAPALGVLKRMWENRFVQNKHYKNFIDEA
jgi:Polysaccharide deacetylase